MSLNDGSGSTLSGVETSSGSAYKAFDPDDAIHLNPAVPTALQIEDAPRAKFGGVSTTASAYTSQSLERTTAVRVPGLSMGGS